MAIVGERKKRKKKSTYAVDAPYSNERWEIERDMESLARADAVKANPERMKKVQMMAKERLEDSKRKKEEAQALIDLGMEA